MRQIFERLSVQAGEGACVPTGCQQNLALMNFTRTHLTDLSDNQLMVFDAIFDHWCSAKGLSKENFRDLHNFAFEHTFVDEELLQVLEELQKRKLIKSKRSLSVSKSRGIRRKINFFTLTSEGGNLWSLERSPDWSRFCLDTAGFDALGSTVEILSPSRHTLEIYVESEREMLAANFGFSPDVSFNHYRRNYLIPWKRFDKVYVASWHEPFSEIQVRRHDVLGTKKSANVWNGVNDLLKELPDKMQFKSQIS